MKISKIQLALQYTNVSRRLSQIIKSKLVHPFIMHEEKGFEAWIGEEKTFGLFSTFFSCRIINQDETYQKLNIYVS